MAHLRYPEDLFKVQRQLLQKYHVTDAGSFYGGQNFWRVPDDPTQQGADLLQPPYYLSLAMPDQTSPAFSLTSTFMPTGDRNVLSGFLAVDGDAGHRRTARRAAATAQLRLLETTGRHGQRPRAGLQRHAHVGRDLQRRLARAAADAGAVHLDDSSTGASVIFGNQLTLPVGGGLLYVQPIYVQARSTRLGHLPAPVGGRRRVRRQDRLGRTRSTRALNDLFGGSSGAQAGDNGTGAHDTDPGHRRRRRRARRRRRPRRPRPRTPRRCPRRSRTPRPAYVEGEAALQARRLRRLRRRRRRELKDALERAVDAVAAGRRPRRAR